MNSTQHQAPRMSGHWYSEALFLLITLSPWIALVWITCFDERDR